MTILRNIQIQRLISINSKVFKKKLSLSKRCFSTELQFEMIALNRSVKYINDTDWVEFTSDSFRQREWVQYLWKWSRNAQLALTVGVDPSSASPSPLVVSSGRPLSSEHMPFICSLYCSIIRWASSSLQDRLCTSCVFSDKAPRNCCSSASSSLLWASTLLAPPTLSCFMIWPMWLTSKNCRWPASPEKPDSVDRPFSRAVSPCWSLQTGSWYRMTPPPASTWPVPEAFACCHSQLAVDWSIWPLFSCISPSCLPPLKKKISLEYCSGSQSAVNDRWTLLDLEAMIWKNSTFIPGKKTQICFVECPLHVSQGSICRGEEFERKYEMISVIIGIKLKVYNLYQL